MHPDSDMCYTCLFTEDFDNKTSISKNSNCIKVDCELPLTFNNNLLHGCAPVFLKPICCVDDSKCRKFVLI